MIRVYVREVEQLNGELLGEFPPSEIQQVVHLFRSFESHVWDDLDVIGPCRLIDGQFVSNETGAFFEIVVGPEEE